MKFPVKRDWRRARSVALVMAIGLLGALLVGSPASAVHDLNFQLEGDVTAATTTTVGGTTQNLDWDSLFNASGGEIDPAPAGFTAATFSNDFSTNPNGSFNTADPTTYTTGSKDTLPIGTGWQCTASNNVNSKIDIMNAYAGAYTDPTTDDDILYFALERNANTGDANVAFWFLQSAVACPQGGGLFQGDHVDGDLLIVSAFTNGGVVSTIDVYRWNGGANGSLGTTPVAHGVDCKTTAGLDTACATVNTATISTPWLTSNKQDGPGHSLRSTEFFEGGLNLTQAELSGHCFNTFTGDTRSSQSLTATLFDFALGTLGECTSTTVTTPTPSGEVTIPANGQVSTSDSALITVTGVDEFTASVTFHLCGPFALGTTTTCDTDGVQIGSAQTVTANGTFVSDTATVTKVGRYCWRADFSGDSEVGVPPSHDSSSGECFTVNPRQPHIVTQAGASPVDFGNPVTDTATLTNTANQPGTGGLGDGSINPTTPGGPAGGTISFTLFKDDCTTVAVALAGTTPTTFPIVVNVSGDGTYGPVSFTPNAPGTYHWVATYSGDSPNTLPTPASESVCGADPNEDVIVRQIPTEIATAQSAIPNDSATITSTVPGDNLPAGGTVVFSLYGPTPGSTALQNCQAGGATGRLYQQTNNNVGGANSVQTATNNTTVSVNVSETYYWLVTYAPGDTAHTGRQSNCAENTVLTFNNDSGPGTLFP